MKKRNLLSVVTLTATLFAGSAHASIIYQIDRTVGNGSVTGTITTDGTLGNLAVSNFEVSDAYPEFKIISWDLLLNDGTDSFRIDAHNSSIFSAEFHFGNSNFWATPNSLRYNFTAPYPIMFYYGDGGSLGYASPNWQLFPGGESVYAGPNLFDESYTDDLYMDQQQTRSWTAESIIGSVPEPGSLALLALGLTGISCVRKLKQ